LASSQGGAADLASAARGRNAVHEKGHDTLQPRSGDGSGSAQAMPRRLQALPCASIV
jgi:hypothetical protein